MHPPATRTGQRRTPPAGPVGRTAAVLAAAAGVAGGVWAGSAPPPAAAQEVRFTFEGRGFGHGVGMSQYGARGAALRGWTAARILRWYYRGTDLVEVPAQPVRVLLTDGVGSVTAGATGPADVVDRGDGRRVALVPDAVHTVSAAGGAVTVTGPGGQTILTSAAGVRIAPEGASLARVAGRRYRGVVDVLPDPGGLRIVNTVPSELYVQGVLPGEMPASWGDETPAALQAQAVAARTYALANRNDGRSFDVYDDTRSQVYVGIDGEDRRANAAVAATRRRVLVHDGRLITAYYSSTSGGHTESVENAFGGSPAPYLTGVPDPYDDVSPLHRWPSPPTFTASALGARLRVGAPVADIDVLARGVSPRVIRARVTTADGRAVELSGSTIKARLGLYDTWFWIRRSDRPAPAEPPVAGAPDTAGEGTPVAAPRRVPDAVRKGRHMVAATRRYRLADARRVKRRLAGLRPRAVILSRTVRGRRIHLVVTGRYPTVAGARRERAALARRGYPAVVVAARNGDPAVRPVRLRPVRAARPAPGPRPAAAPAATPPPPATPATPAGTTYTVIAADVPHHYLATEAVTRLGRAGRSPVIVARWSRATGTRYLVVTLTAVPSARATAERTALRALGFTPRLEAVRTGS